MAFAKNLFRKRAGDVAAVVPNAIAPAKSPEERSLVRRLDTFLLTFGCLSQIIKSLDQSNIQNAYVSGMKEDLELFGNELNLFTTYFNVAYCLMIIPSQIIITYVRPSYWLPTLEVIWGVITGLIAIAHSAKQVYVLRVFLGLCEAAAYPGMITLFMSWYTPLEMAKRIGFYHSCQAIGQIISGAMQAAIVSSMEGRNGLSGWRWLFVVNAIITVVQGGMGYIMLPDTPNRPNSRAFWLKNEHSEYALYRLEREHREDMKPITWAAAKRAFSKWIVYVITIMYVAMVTATQGYNFFNLFLKVLKNADGSPRWTVWQINVIPIGGSVMTVVFVWIWALLSDMLRTRWTLINVQALISLVAAIILSVWTSNPDSTSLASAYTGYFMSFLCCGTAPLIWAWLSDLCSQESEERALTVGAAITGYYAISCWSQVLIWPAEEAPYYKVGWQVCAALSVLVMILVVVLRVYEVKYIRPKKESNVMEAGAKEVDDEIVPGKDNRRSPTNEVEDE